MGGFFAMSLAPATAAALKWVVGVGLLFANALAQFSADAMSIGLSDGTLNALNGLGVAGGALLYRAAARVPNAK